MDPSVPNAPFLYPLKTSENHKTFSGQGVSYSQKFRGKRSFLNMANSRTFQFTFPKYLTEYPNVKIVKSKFKSEKSQKNKHKSNVVLKGNEKKRH